MCNIFSQLTFYVTFGYFCYLGKELYLTVIKYLNFDIEKGDNSYITDVIKKVI